MMQKHPQALPNGWVSAPSVDWQSQEAGPADSHILRQASVAGLEVPKHLLYIEKDVLYLGPHTGLTLFHESLQRVYS